MVAKRAMKTYRDKMFQADREAKVTLVALAAIVLVWLTCGIGLAGSDIEVFHTPIWIIGGTVGTWIAAIVAAIVLVKCVFADMDLDDKPAGALDGEAVGGEAAEDLGAAEEACRG